MSIIQGPPGSESTVSLDADAGGSSRPAYHGVHARTILLGMVLVAAMAYIAPYADLVVKQLQLGTLQFAPGAVGAFLIVYISINALRRMGFLRWINSADMLTIYVMLFVGVFVAARGLLERLIPTLAYLNYYATPQNGYNGLFAGHLKPALVAFNPADAHTQTAVTNFFQGGRDLPIPWEAWIPPLLSWFLLFSLIIWTFLCLSTILRQQWSDSERLSFPLTILPMQLLDTNDASLLFRNPVTWIGIGIPFIIYLLNGLHESFPTVPLITLEFDNVQKVFTSPPWDTMQSISVYLSFAAMGFAYLLPSDLLFSLWFFFLLTRLGDVVARMIGIIPTGMPSYPTEAYIGYQAAGAYVMLALSFGYSGRHYFKKAFREAFHSVQNPSEDAHELLPRRTAVFGLFAGFIGIVGWSIWAGLSPWLAISVWAIYIFVTATVLARGVCEAGLLMTETSFRPTDLIGIFSPRVNWGPTNWAILSMFNAVFFRDMRGLFLALFMDDQRLAGDVKMRRRNLLLPLLLAIVVSLIVGSATHLALNYQHGAVNLYSYGTANASWAYTDAAGILKGTPDALATAKDWFSVGFVVTAILTVLRARFVGFPLHPLAYALAPTWTLIVIWFPVFVIWVVKTLILRYGGLSLYRKARPLFLGMILGEFGSGVMWAIIAAVTKVNAPLFPWGG